MTTIVRITTNGAAHVPGGKAGMLFEADKFTDEAGGRVARVRDWRYPGKWLPFSIITIPADGYQIVGANETVTVGTSRAAPADVVEVPRAILTRLLHGARVLRGQNPADWTDICVEVTKLLDKDILPSGPTITIDTIIAAVAADNADPKSELVSSLAGEGTPRDVALAERLGPDYICALDDGRCVAWGDEHDSRRDIVVYNDGGSTVIAHVGKRA